MTSVWLEQTELPERSVLEGDRKTDVLIVGGGLTGILCAHLLAQAGVDYILIEADRLCRGTTGGTTAKITAQHGLIYDTLIRRFGEEKARMYLEANQAAVERYRRLAGSIDCGFEGRDSFVYSQNRGDRLERELAALERIGYHPVFREELPLPIRITGAVGFGQQAQFDPVRFVKGLVPELKLYEKTPARSVQGSTVYTDRGRITASRIIVATHFPFINKHGSYFVKMYQQRSYVLALEGAQQVDGMYRDEQENGLSFRDHQGLLLLGGGSHRTGKPGAGWLALSAFAQKQYPEARERYRWAAQDCMTLDGMPYIGRYAKTTPNLYVATGFNKWGMTGAMIAATILCDMVREIANPYEPLFSPSRTMLRPQLAVNAAESAANLLTLSAPRCTHMGCALKWNPQERSWDCPCHGSRFSGKGELLNEPAVNDLPTGKADGKRV